MDTAQWPQEIVVKPMEEILTNTTSTCSKPSSLERRVRPQKEQALNCPRCNSTNTKFCYYNNYSLSQPRYFCKTCRRYWTEGGSLRNIPVGGGSRKNKRSSSSSSASSQLSSASSNKKFPDLAALPPPNSSQNPKIIHQDSTTSQDLNLGFPSTNDFKTISELIQVPNFEGNLNKVNQIPNSSALELLNGIRGLNSFMPMPISDPNTVYSSSGFPSLGFSLDGLGSSGGNYGSMQETHGGRLLFPFEDLKQVSNNTTDSDQHNNREHVDSNGNGYWKGMLGGGSW